MQNSKNELRQITESYYKYWGERNIEIDYAIKLLDNISY